MTYRLLILACSARKKPGPAWMPAMDRYDGPLWQTLRSTPQPENLVVMALSAKYGLFRAWLAIDLYDESMTLELARAAATENVCDPFHPLYRPHWGGAVNELSDAAEAIRLRMGTRYCEQFQDVCLVGGWKYLPTMRRYVNHFRSWGGSQETIIAGDARVTEVNGAIGRMRQAMRSWICEADRISCTKHVDFRIPKSEDSPTSQRYSGPPT